MVNFYSPEPDDKFIRLFMCVLNDSILLIDPVTKKIPYRFDIKLLAGHDFNLQREDIQKSDNYRDVRLDKSFQLKFYPPQEENGLTFREYLFTCKNHKALLTFKGFIRGSIKLEQFNRDDKISISIHDYLRDLKTNHNRSLRIEPTINQIEKQNPFDDKFLLNLISITQNDANPAIRNYETSYEYVNRDNFVVPLPPRHMNSLNYFSFQPELVIKQKEDKPPRIENSKNKPPTTTVNLGWKKKENKISPSPLDLSTAAERDPLDFPELLPIPAPMPALMPALPSPGPLTPSPGPLPPLSGPLPLPQLRDPKQRLIRQFMYLAGIILAIVVFCLLFKALFFP